MIRHGEGSKHSGHWIVDSGATCHICNDVSCCISLKHLEKPIEVIIGDERSLKADKCGTIKLSIQSPDGGKRIL